MEKIINYKREMKILFGIMFLFIMLLSIVSASTIQQFLVDMKEHPENYNIVINRSIEEINLLKQKTSLQELSDYFQVPIVNSPIKGKNFLLIEIPKTEFGQAYTQEKDFSYIQLNEDWLVDENQNLSYYTENDFPMFNFLAIYLAPQEFIFDKGNSSSIQEQLNKLELDGDGEFTERDLVLYYMQKLILRVLDYTSSPINSDYVIIYNNEPLVLDSGQRDFCEGFNGNSIYIFNNYTYFDYNFQKNITIWDKCEKQDLLSEVNCVGLELKQLPVACPQGYTCSNGACVNPEQPSNSIFTLIIRFLTGNISINEILQALFSWVSN